MITILEAIKKHMEQGEDLVLAVVWETEGSVPRGKGAAMLIGSSGILKGSIGGGALEAAVLRAGGECLDQKRSAALTYGLDGGKLLTQNAGDALPTGMICGGRVSVWLQYICSGDRTWQEQCDQALLLLKAGCSAQLSFDPFSLPLDPPDRALLFGGGHIAKALTPILASVGFRVVVMDERPEFAANGRFPNAAQVVCGDFGRLDGVFTFRDNDYAVVVTSGHQHDFEVEEQLLRRSLAYVGVIGSRKKTAAVNAKLKAAGIPEEKLAQVHTPIGLDIGAVTPEEIAVSIAAEMIAVRANRRSRTFGAVVPAAGLSSRMGAFKPLLDLGGKPLICRTLDSLRNAGCGKIFVVTGHRADELEAAAAAPDVHFVRNPDYASTGMLESVQKGLFELLREDPPDFVILLPGDVPLVNSDTMHALNEAARNGAAIARPSHQGKAGHPVLLDRAMAEQLLEYSGPDGVRGFLRGHPDGTVFLETDDPRILTDVDTPEDYQKWNK